MSRAGWSAVVALAILAAPSADAWGQVSADPPVGQDVSAALRQIHDGHPVEGRKALEALVKAGRADAAEALGEILQGGYLGPPDRKAACELFVQSSKTWGAGMHNLALCYEQGVNGPPDLARAAGLYERAGQMGYPKAKCALGNLLIAGRGVPADPPRGLALCKEAADAGVADAQADVGNQYLMGRIVPRDPVEARRWYQKAADQHQHQAARTLGEMYARGDGGPQSWSEAKRLWRVAAEAGDVQAPELLAKRLTVELLAADFRPGDPRRAADIAEAIKWSQVTIADNPDPKEVEAAKGGVAILRGMQEGERKLMAHPSS
ncbi:MAG TPA: tetratricopeptide repeat protein [Phenylobacterium sp.]|jgi:TPR repeat protein|nr:tetratricopeptide repeat protein [Phenylobacterium sp.]